MDLFVRWILHTKCLPETKVSLLFFMNLLISYSLQILVVAEQISIPSNINVGTFISIEYDIILIPSEDLVYTGDGPN